MPWYRMRRLSLELNGRASRELVARFKLCRFRVILVRLSCNPIFVDYAQSYI